MAKRTPTQLVTAAISPFFSLIDIHLPRLCLRRLLESHQLSSEDEGRFRRVRVTVGHNYQELFRLLATCSVVGFYVKQESLEDVFMKYYGEEADRE